jgi:hypothetical protein
MLSNYLQSQHNQMNISLIEIYCDLLNTHRIHWSESFIENVAPAVQAWADWVDREEYPWMGQALTLIG